MPAKQRKQRSDKGKSRKPAQPAIVVNPGSTTNCKAAGKANSQPQKRNSKDKLATPTRGATKESKINLPVCKASGKAKVTFVRETVINGMRVKVYHTDSPTDTRHLHTYGVDLGSNRIVQRNIYNQTERIIAKRKDHSIVAQFGTIKLDNDQIKVWREIKRYSDGREDTVSWKVSDSYSPRVYPLHYADIGVDYITMSDATDSKVTEVWSKSEIASVVKSREKRSTINDAPMLEVQGDGSKHDPYDALIAKDANEGARREAQARLGKPFAKHEDKPAKRKARKESRKANKAQPVKTEKRTANKRTTRKGITRKVNAVATQNVATITGESTSYADCLGSIGYGSL